MHRARTDWPLLALLVAVVFGIGWLVSSFVVMPAGGWTSDLVLPRFRLPPMVDGVLSIVLTFAYAVVGWRAILDRDWYDMAIWLAVLVLSWLFTPLFVVFRAYYPALAIVVAMAVLLVVLTARLMRTDGLSALLTAPSAFYVIYTAVMTLAVIGLNGL